MIYFDNAATTYPKPSEVSVEVLDTIMRYGANPGRSGHKLSIAASEKVYATREKVAKLLSYDSPENVVFTQNATYALNLAIKGMICEKCHVITSDAEHNSVLRPLETLKARYGVEYSTFESDGDIETSIKGLVRSDTKAIISTLTSNVTGKEIPLEILSRISRQLGIPLIVDASQLIGHKRINLKETPCDVLCAPGHKGLFGIQGSGFALISSPLIKNGLAEGGSGTNSMNLSMPEYLPERFEAGTLPTPAICSLGAGIDFIENYGIDRIEEKLNMLTRICSSELRKLHGTEIFGDTGGIVSFRMKGIAPDILARYLDDEDICVRAGLHCAPMIHKKLGSEKTGLVRVSFSVFNEESEIFEFIKALKNFSNKI